MRKAFYTTFTVLVFTVLFCRMLGWILHFSESLDHMLNIAMFSLIGIAYIVMGLLWRKRMQQLINILCGAFLIGMNFFESNNILNIIGIVCILTPMLIARFGKTEGHQADWVTEENIL